MRHCPICDARYDDDTIKVCTKDGTPLVDDGRPNFVILPSENIEQPPSDFGEETVIRRKSEAGSASEPERIVIPTMDREEPRIRPRQQVYYQPPEPPNTMKVVALTIIGTLVVLSFGAGLFWLFQKDTAVNMNVNTNPINLNADSNTNLGFNSNFNFNTNFNANTNVNGYASNFNFNFNFNAPSKTATSTPTPRRSPSPSPSPLFPSPSPTPRQSVVSPSPRAPRPPMMTNRPPSGGN